jgi:hypothetical protein
LFDMTSDTGQSKTIIILPSKYVIGNKTALIMLVNTVTTPFSDRKLPLYFKIPDADGAEVDCGNNARKRLEYAPDELKGPVYKGVIDCPDSSQITATTSDRTRVFRVFSFSVKVPTLFDFGRKHEDGLVQVRGTEGQFTSGFLYQVIPKLNDGAFYKTWPGAYKTKPLIVPRMVTILIKPGVWIYEVWLTGQNPPKMWIPWGIGKYVADPAKFLESLGVEKEGKNFTRCDAVFQVDGRIHTCGKPIKVLRLRRLNMANFVDLDLGSGWKAGQHDVCELQKDGKTWKKLIGNNGYRDYEDDDSEGEEVSVGLEEGTLLMIEVAVGAFVGSLIIGLIGFAVYKRRSKGKRNSSSPRSDQSSSDELREEGLLEVN